MLFFLGVICGPAAIILWALFLAAKPKPAKAEPQGGIATSVSMNGNSGESMEAAHARMLNDALEKAGHGKLFELPGQHTRH